MSILSIPIVADTLARVMNRLAYGNLNPRLRFEEIPGRRSEIHIPTRHGPVRAHLYLPPEGTERPGVYVNFHGGGFVFRDIEQDDPFCRYLAAHAGVVVLNVDYDVAPQHRFPVPVEEAFDAVRWAAGEGHDWDGARLCVGGQSAGGNLSAAVARLSLEAGGPPIALQVLHYAPLDLSVAKKPAPAGQVQVVPNWMARIFRTAYLPAAEMQTHRLASPLHGDNARDLEGIAPALVITAEYDNLHADGAAYAEVLRRAGALAEHIEVKGARHAYNILTGSREQTERTYAAIAGHVRRALGAG